MSAVQGRDGITHAVVLEPDHGLAGCTACDIRFWTVRLGTPSVFVIGRDERMADVETDVDCMSCLVGLPAYDEACTEGSPPESGTA